MIQALRLTTTLRPFDSHARSLGVALCVLALVLVACGDPPAADGVAGSGEVPAVDALEGARQALEDRDWEEAQQLAMLAVEAGVEVEAARAIVDQARAEIGNQTRLLDASALFDAEQYTRAYLKLLDFPDDSTYAHQVSNMLVRIRHAAVLPEVMRRADGMTMQRIVIGSFLRGSTSREAKRAHNLCEKHAGQCQLRWFDREQPRRRIVTGSFYIDTFEVSVAQYAACVASGGCAAVDWSACGLDDEARRRFDDPQLPQVCVTWDEAAAYCAHHGARLPTETEWERAAAGPRSRRFPWGSAWKPNAANWAAPAPTSDGHDELAPVDAYAPRASGLFNMAGNAYEWVADWYDEAWYGQAPETNPAGPDTGSMRVIRGGAWNSSPSSLRTAHRNRMTPTDRDRTVGFRCAASPSSLPAP